MTRSRLKQHPCDRGEETLPWKPDHLYVGDRGGVLCGRCMTVESTYMPWAYSDLGRMGPDRSITCPPEVLPLEPGHYVEVGTTVYRCENDPDFNVGAEA